MVTQTRSSSPARQAPPAPVRRPRPKATPASPDSSRLQRGAPERIGAGAQNVANVWSQALQQNRPLELGRGELLRRGRGGDPAKIRQLQERLNQRGARLRVDGRFGARTQAAVRRFQKTNELSPDGIVGPETLRALNGAPPQSGRTGEVDRVGQPERVGRPGRAGRAERADRADVDTRGTPAQLARRILDSDRISLLDRQVSGRRDGADARSNLRDTANGNPARRSRYGNGPGGRTNLNPRMLRAMLELSKKYRFRVTSIAGGSHSRRSRHYRGVGFDVDTINGRRVGPNNPHWRAFLRDARRLGATELLGPGHRGHSRHVHVAW